MSKNVLITGASSGFGLLTTKTLTKAGYTVVASMRDPLGRNKSAADELTAAGAKVVEIDVTNDESVDAGVAAARKEVGEIDVLINNAGVGVSGLQEAFTIEDWQRVFDINVFGVQRLSRAVLPEMRKRNDGLIINVSSLLGRFVLPFFGPYNATKYALEALTDNYRVELSSFGIETAIVEPGGFGTDFGSRLIQASDTERTKEYGPLADGPEQQFAEFEKNFESDNAPDPQMVPDAILRIIEAPRGERPFRTVVDGMGMGEPIERINVTAEESTSAIYSAFGMEGMLKPHVSAQTVGA